MDPKILLLVALMGMIAFLAHAAPFSSGQCGTSAWRSTTRGRLLRRFMTSALSAARQERTTPSVRSPGAAA
jgi:hypothetical protein